MKNILVCLAIAILVIGFAGASTAYAQTLPESYKRSFIAGGVRSCMEKQHRDPLSSSLGDKKLKEFCTCAMTRAADVLTIKDLRHVFETHDKRRLNAVIKAAGRKCMRELMVKWGYMKKQH